MSQQNVKNVIDRLLTEEDLRVRFALARFDTIAEMHMRGLDLTSDEIDAFVQSDAQMWFGEMDRVCEPLH